MCGFLRAKLFLINSIILRLKKMLPNKFLILFFSKSKPKDWEHSELLANGRAHILVLFCFFKVLSGLYKLLD